MDEPARGIEPRTFSLRMKCSATELYGQVHVMTTILNTYVIRNNMGVDDIKFWVFNILLSPYNNGSILLANQ